MEKEQPILRGAIEEDTNMPYINDAKRTCLKVLPEPVDAGELNYLITKLCHQYLITKDERYQTYNDIMGALEGAKLELYRRKIAAYEDLAKEKNGDV